MKSQILKSVLSLSLVLSASSALAAESCDLKAAENALVLQVFHDVYQTGKFSRGIAMGGVGGRTTVVEEAWAQDVNQAVQDSFKANAADRETIQSYLSRFAKFLGRQLDCPAIYGLEGRPVTCPPVLTVKLRGAIPAIGKILIKDIKNAAREHLKDSCSSSVVPSQPMPSM